MDNKLKTVDAETLLSTPMSKTMFIVDGLISQGVNVISGASKIGKSWLMLWLGLRPYFAGRQCHQRCQQDRQKLADAVAGAASGAGKFRLGFAHVAMRCALSEP